jgi:hypothetical protein
MSLSQTASIHGMDQLLCSKIWEQICSEKRFKKKKNGKNEVFFFIYISYLLLIPSSLSRGIVDIMT